MGIFDDIVETFTPKVNKDVMDGIVTRYLTTDNIIKRMETIIYSASESFPEGLKYTGRCEMATTQQEYDWTAKAREEGKRNMEISTSDVFLVLFYFEYKGEPLEPAYIYLPFCRKGGVCYFSETQYRYMAVMSDKIITPGPFSVFVKLQLRDRLNFMSLNHSIVVNGQVENAAVVWSSICRKPTEKVKLKDTTKAVTCCGHYLLAVHGFSGCMSVYYGLVKNTDYVVLNETDVDMEKYPVSKWNIYRSLKIAPKTYIGNYYNSSKLCVAVRKEKCTHELKVFLTSFYYVVDHFPESLKIDSIDSKIQYIVLLGHIVRSGLYSSDKLITFISNHFSELDSYLDTISKQKLKEINIHVKDFYELLFYLCTNYRNLTTTSKEKVSSMFGKHLEVLYYVLYPLSSHLLKTVYGLTNNRKPNIEINVKYLNQKFISPLCQRKIYDLTKGGCAAIEQFSYPGDHLYPLITSKINHQETIPAARSGGKTRNIAGPDKYFHISMAEAGCMLVLPKRDPMPWKHLNPYTKIDLEIATILPNPKNFEILLKTKPLIDVYDDEPTQIEKDMDGV